MSTPSQIRFLLLAIFLCLVTIACSSPKIDLVLGEESASPLKQKIQPIINGSAPNQSYHDAVVSLHRVSSGSVYVSPFCSGTLIAKDVVLTAAHCLDIASSKKRTYQTMSPSSLAIYVGNNPAVDIASHIYPVTQNLIYSGYNRKTSTGDIALIRLAREVTETSPVPHLPTSEALTNADLGRTLNFAGFGRTETGSSGVKLQVNGTLDGFGCVVPGCLNGGQATTQISYSQPTGGPCSGDSGGPAFLSKNGTTYVVGVTSYGDRNCVYYGVSTRTDAFDSWIRSFLGTSPTEPDCSADGTCNSECSANEDPDCNTGGGNNNCGDGVCAAGESCDGRNGTSACPSDCRGKVNGKPSTRYCYVEGTCQGGGCP